MITADDATPTAAAFDDDEECADKSGTGTGAGNVCMAAAAAEDGGESTLEAWSLD